MHMDSQLSAFLTTIATGITLGVLFDCYRVLRGTFRPKVLVTWVTDLLYWLVATVIVFIALVISNWGELRFYVFLGISCGVALYYRLLSLWVIRVLSFVIKLIKDIATLVRKSFILFVIRPVVICFRIISWPFRFLDSKVRGWYHVKYPKPPIDEKKI